MNFDEAVSENLEGRKELILEVISTRQYIFRGSSEENKKRKTSL